VSVGCWGWAEADEVFPCCLHFCMPICMQSTSVRIDVATHEELKRLASVLGTTVGETAALAVRRLRRSVLGGNWPPRCRPTRPRGSMLNSGDVVELDLGVPSGRERASGTLWWWRPPRGSWMPRRV